MTLKEEAISIFTSTLRNVDPGRFLPGILTYDSESDSLKIENHLFQLRNDQKVYVIGSGKASTTMAGAVEKVMLQRLESGFIISPPHSRSNLNKIRMIEGAHPIPDKNSLDATDELLKFIASIPGGSLVINLISGGTSSLLCKPVESISIYDLQKVYQILLKSGAAIQEINAVRKTLSQVKGGQLLGHLHHVQLVDLIISDVSDDDLRYIGSGPTVAQEISFEDAIGIAHSYEFWEKLPKDVQNHLTKYHKKEMENRKSRVTADFDEHYAWIVSSAKKVALETVAILEEKGYETKLFEPAWSGSIDEFEEYIYQNILSCLYDDSTGRTKALLFYGECTVTITGNGKGGRNQELALRMAKKLSQLNRSVVFLSAGTDGVDGPTDVAGAVVDHLTQEEAEKKKLNIDQYLSNNDSYHFFQHAGGHIVTQPTGNNVMDQQIILIKGNESIHRFHR